MTPSRVQDMAEDMMVSRFNWQRSGPIDVAEGPHGARIILDGHHRTQAAIQANVDSVPVRIQFVSPSRWQRLLIEVLEAQEGR
jgi:hypothetical protein